MKLAGLTYGAAQLIAQVPAVMPQITLPAAMDTGAIGTLELIWAASGPT